MDEKIVEIAKKEVADFEGKKITRKEAIKKTGYIAVSAATMMILLNSPKAQAGSGCDRYPDKGSNHGSNNNNNHHGNNNNNNNHGGNNGGGRRP